MKYSSEVVREHLIKERDNGAPMAILTAQAALFAASRFLHQTTFNSKHDAEGIKTVLLYHIATLLLPHSKLLSGLKFLRRTCGSKVNLIANCSFLVLAILFEKFYEKSLGSLGVVLSTAILVLLLLILIRPRSDLGFVGFLLGVAGSIAYNLYRLEYRTWVVAVICFVLFGFKCWLDKNWLEVEDDDEIQKTLPVTTTTNSGQEHKRRISKSVMIEALIVPIFYLYWDQDLLRIDCPPDSDLISCISYSLKESVLSVVVLGLCSSLAIALRLYTLLGRDKHESHVIEKKDVPNDKNEIMSVPHPVGLSEDTLNQRHKQSASDEEVDARADDFINKFKHQLKLQRLDARADDFINKFKHQLELQRLDARADDFINKFKHQLKLQRLDSILRYKEMLRGNEK